MSPLSLCFLLSLVPTFCLSNTRPDSANYPGAEPLNFFDKLAQYFFDPPSWVRKYYRWDALKTYSKERWLLPFHRFRSKPVTESPSTTSKIDVVNNEPVRYGSYQERH